MKRLLSLLLMGTTSAGCTSVNRVTREQIVDLAQKPEGNGTLVLYTDRGDVVAESPRALHLVDQKLVIDAPARYAAAGYLPLTFEPREVRYGDLTVPDAGKTAGFVVGVTLGTLAVAALVFLIWSANHSAMGLSSF